MSHTYIFGSEDQSLESRTHFLTFFDDKFAFVKYEDQLTLPELATEIALITDSAKSKLPWVKMAMFGDAVSAKGCFRTDSNVLAVSGLEIDHDKGTLSFDEAIARLDAAEVRSIVYTSGSYVAGAKEKWRCLVPFSELLVADERALMVARINGILGGAAERESFVLSQAYYYGSVNSNADHAVVVIDGEFVDLRDDLDDYAIGKPALIARPNTRINTPTDDAPPIYSEEQIQNLLERSRLIGPGGEGQWHDSMRAIAASRVAKGWSDREIMDLVRDYCQGGAGDADMQKLIDTARQRWGKPNPDVDLSQTAVGAAIRQLAASQGISVPRSPNWRERYVATGWPKASLHNAIAAIVASGFECSEDSFHNKLYLGRSSAASPAVAPLPFLGQVTDTGLLGLRVWLSDHYGFDLGEKFVRDAVVQLCRANAFDPVADMLWDAELNWDGIARLDRMAADYFNCEDTVLNAACVRKTMIAAVRRVRQPGCKFDTILTMESEEGWNKSSSWAVLAGEGNFSDASIIGHGGREVQEQLAGVWIHENPELAGMRKAEVEVVKAFASRQVDRARPAYGHLLVEQPRHSIEIGTTNSDRYLQSQTGNRRFWPIRVLAMIDLAKLRAARLQLWGEAASYESSGESLVLDESLWQAARAEQEQRRVQHPWEALLGAMSVIPERSLVPINERVLTHVDGELRVHTRTIFSEVLKMTSGQLNRGHAMALAETMRALGWKHKESLRIDGMVGPGYVKPGSRKE